VAALPLAVAVAKPAPGAMFVGAPAHFGTDRMHLRVTSDGKEMHLVGLFAWSYGCHVIGNYGAADAQTLGHNHSAGVALFPAPVVAIHRNSFSGSDEFRSNGRSYGRFTIKGTFTNAHTARASFSFADPPHCGTFTEHFTMSAAG
jgi:hypothetical protein